MKETKLSNKAFEAAYERVHILQQQIAALHYATQGIMEFPYQSRAKEEFGNLHAELYNKLNDAYGSLFMWGIVNDDKKLMIRAKYAAYNHYLKNNSAIMGYLEFHGSYPAELEKKFREELEFLKKNNNE